jgi:hypothetical protein
MILYESALFGNAWLVAARKVCVAAFFSHEKVARTGGAGRKTLFPADGCWQLGVVWGLQEHHPVMR